MPSRFKINSSHANYNPLILMGLMIFMYNLFIRVLATDEEGESLVAAASALPILPWSESSLLNAYDGMCPATLPDLGTSRYINTNDDDAVPGIQLNRERPIIENTLSISQGPRKFLGIEDLKVTDLDNNEPIYNLPVCSPDSLFKTLDSLAKVREQFADTCSGISKGEVHEQFLNLCADLASEMLTLRVSLQTCVFKVETSAKDSVYFELANAPGKEISYITSGMIADELIRVGGGGRPKFQFFGQASGFHDDDSGDDSSEINSVDDTSAPSEHYFNESLTIR